jgi:hypothetical protein
MTLSPTKMPLPDTWRQLRWRSLFQDDFLGDLVTADKWTIDANNSGGVAISDAADGVAVISPSDGSVVDNDEAYLISTSELWLFDEGRSIAFETRGIWNDAGAAEANFYAGLASGAADFEDFLGDNGGGVEASVSFAGFIAVDGNANWQIGVGIGASREVVSLTAANSLDKQAHAHDQATANQHLSFFVNPRLDGTMDVVFCIEGEPVYIVESFSMTSATEMRCVFGAKNGANTNHQTPNIDYVQIAQGRL